MAHRRDRVQSQEQRQSDTIVETSQLLMQAFRSVRMKGVSMPRIGRIKAGMARHPAFSEAVRLLEREKII